MRQYSLRKPEGKRVERWESEFERIVNGNKNILSPEEVRKQIAETLENNAIEQTKVSLICPLTKERIEVPARYRDCRHLQCFDLKAFLAMKAKRNFLACPICNTKIDRELTITSLCIDKFFQNILSELSSSTEAVILSDGTYKATFSHSALIAPEVIDDEEPYEADYSATLKCEVKSETGSDDDDVEVLDSVTSIDNEANESNAETQDAHMSDASMESDTSQEVDRSTIIDEIESETSINVDNVDEQGSISRFDFDSEANSGDAETQNLHFPDTYVASDTNQTVHSTIGKSGTNIGRKRHKCTHCSYASNNCCHLLNHSRTHIGEKPFKCNKCSFASAQLSNLKSHIAIHNGKKPYKCDQCSYASVKADNLKTHIRIHSGEKPFKCNKCSFACAAADGMKRHMRSHTGEKRYKCSLCSFACAFSGDLKRHMRTHTGEKPYKCSHCSFASARSYDLKKHMRTHV